jgi:hypothetical protein
VIKKAKSKSKSKVCACCGVFCQSKFCGQCKFAGCDGNRRGDRCRLSVGAHLSHSIPAPAAVHQEVFK